MWEEQQEDRAHSGRHSGETLSLATPLQLDRLRMEQNLYYAFRLQAHRVPQLVLKNVRLVYLPYHIRPLEKLISKFKLFYREQLVRELAVMCDHSLQRIKAASTVGTASAKKSST